VSPLVRISPAAVSKTVLELDKRSSGRREAVAFWLGSPESLAVQTIAIPTGRGVVLERRSLRLSEVWMNVLGAFCDRSGQIVLAGVHCHPEDAFYSEIDSDGFFHAPDFVSIVLPRYAKTALENAESEWAVYVGLPWGKWRRSRWGIEVSLVDPLPFELQTLSVPD